MCVLDIEIGIQRFQHAEISVIKKCLKNICISKKSWRGKEVSVLDYTCTLKQKFPDSLQIRCVFVPNSFTVYTNEHQSGKNYHR